VARQQLTRRSHCGGYFLSAAPDWVSKEKKDGMKRRWRREKKRKKNAETIQLNNDILDS
jgi:hypothetical protein